MTRIEGIKKRLLFVTNRITSFNIVTFTLRNRRVSFAIHRIGVNLIFPFQKLGFQRDLIMVEKKFKKTVVCRMYAMFSDNYVAYLRHAYILTDTYFSTNI